MLIISSFISSYSSFSSVLVSRYLFKFVLQVIDSYSTFALTVYYLLVFLLLFYLSYLNTNPISC